MIAAQRIPLIEQVINAVVLDKAVGIVQQANAGRQMPGRAVRIAQRSGWPFMTARSACLIKLSSSIIVRPCCISAGESTKAPPKAIAAADDIADQRTGLHDRHAGDRRQPDRVHADVVGHYPCAAERAARQRRRRPRSAG